MAWLPPRDEAGVRIDLSEVAKVAPSLVVTSSEGEVQGVKYDRLNVVLINAMQEQQRELETLRAANATLNARLQAIEEVIAKSTVTERPPP